MLSCYWAADLPPHGDIIIMWLGSTVTGEAQQHQYHQETEQQFQRLPLDLEKQELLLKT